MGQLGEVLREARMAMGVSLPQVEGAIHIRERILAALEDGDYADLPAPVYLRGLARSYASYLKLDLAQINQLLDEDLGLVSVAEIRPSVKSPPSASAITGEMLVLALVVVGLLAAAWYVYGQWGALREAIAPRPSAVAVVRTATIAPTRVKDTPIPPITVTVQTVSSATTPSPAPTSTKAPTPLPSPTPAPTIAATPTPEFGVTIEARFTKRCWVDVKVDGESVFTETVPAGATRVWKGRDSVWMHAGQPDGVEITFNGKNLGVLSSSGGTVKVEWTRP